MVCTKSQKLSAKKVKNAKKLMQNSAANAKFYRIQQQIKSDLSPKFTEMKTGGRISRFGRPQTATKQDASSIPTEIAKFISKHSPKRPKPKETEMVMNDRIQEETTSDSSMVQDEAFSQLIMEQSLLTDTIQVEGPEENSIEVQEKIQETNEVVESQEPQELNKIETVDQLASQTADQLVSIYENEALLDSVKEAGEIHQDEDSDVSVSDKGKHDFSDTDSALGSTVSCPEKDSSFYTGQMLWGSFGTQSWWPCIVFPYDEEGNIIKQDSKHKQIHIKYFNWRGYKAYLPIKNVFEYQSIEDFHAQIKKRQIKRIKPFTPRCYKAVEEANFFKTLSVEDRLAIFDETVQLQLAQPKDLKSLELKGESSTSLNDSRKSVDSAHESSASPTPSSPQYHPTKICDLISSYRHTMMLFDLNNNNNVSARPKRNRKSSAASADVTVATETKQEEVNRRRSARPVKKRKFKDFEHDTKSEADGTERPMNSSIIEPKAKRAKLVLDETLEDRFLIDTELLRHHFRNGQKSRICMECLKPDAEPTYRCSGNGDIKCSGWFHKGCSGHFEMKREEFRHQCGDSDEIIQTQAVKTILMCKTCHLSTRNCFVCTKPVVYEVDEIQNCPNLECRLTYHSDCLKMWPQNKMIKGGSKRLNQCPQHLCHTCFSKDIHNTGSLIKCMKCPAAYHLQLSCVPAGTQILSQTQIICPRHPTEKELQKNLKDKNAKPLNVDWCTICSDSGNLVCCESCPNAFHTECIDNEFTDENYYCKQCQEGRLPLYYTIVWARVGAYRWWPGLIMTHNVIPEATSKSRKHDREFCVRFFGSYDYSWFTCERVFQYDGSDVSVRGTNSRLDSAFTVALEEARQFAGILAKNDPQYLKAKPKPYIKLSQNRLIHPVKLRKIDEHTRELCNCKSTDLNPCGKDSDCINMHLNIECDKKCEAGSACQNQKIRNREYVPMKVLKTENRGFGVVTTKDVPAGSFVIEYVGDLIDTKEFNKRMNEKIRNKEKEFYFLTVEADLYVDAEPAGNVARFINHSCKPNCKSRKVAVDGNTRIGIFALEDIKAGTELTFDYQMEFVDNKNKFACFCGAENCSGLIGEKPKEEKKVAEKVTKKKPKRKSVKLPQMKKSRGIDDTVDPLAVMIEKLPEKLGLTVSSSSAVACSSSLEEASSTIASSLSAEACSSSVVVTLSAGSQELNESNDIEMSTVETPAETAMPEFLDIIDTAEANVSNQTEAMSEGEEDSSSIDPFYEMLADTTEPAVANDAE